MKEWPANHPQAKLMARKRAVILNAAHESFLRDGYESTSMEAIAAKAGVSIMTLYRHAENKESLFAAVIESACHPEDHAQRARAEDSFKRPLGDVLVQAGMIIQERLSSPVTVALFRAIMAESSRQPALSAIAYNGLIRSHEDTLDNFLSQRTEADTLDLSRRQALCAAFIDRLIGADSFRVLLGLEGTSKAAQLERAKSACAELINALG